MPGFLRLILIFVIKLTLLPLMPILIILEQAFALPVLFEIERFKKTFMPEVSAKERLRRISVSTERAVANFLQKMFLVGNHVPDSDEHDAEKVEKKIEEFMDSPTYEKSKCCRDFDKLSDLSESKFYESFIEAGPQTILQLMIYLQIGLEMNVFRFLAILTSISTLAQTVVDYYSSAMKKNPARRELTLVGQLAIVATKTPALIARCLVLSVFFTSEKLQVGTR